MQRQNTTYEPRPLVSAEQAPIMAKLERRHRLILELRDVETELRDAGLDLFFLTSAVRPSQPETRNLERR